MKVFLILNCPHGNIYEDKDGKRTRLSIDKIFEILNSVSPLESFKCELTDYWTYEIETRMEERPIEKLRKELETRFWETIHLVVSISIPRVEFNKTETTS